MQDRELEALAQAIAQKVQKEPANQRSIQRSSPISPHLLFRDETTRESRIRWLRLLRRTLEYMHVELFFRQALAGRKNLEELTDQEIVALHRTINEARDYYDTSDSAAYDDLLRLHG